MKTDIWMPIFIGDYLKDTQSLTAEEHGAYFLIMMELWVKGGEIPLRTINRIARIDKSRWDSEVWPILQDFLTVNNGMVSQNRLTVELKKATNNRETAKKNGATGGRPRGDNKPRNNLGVNPDHNPNPNPEKTSSPSPSPSSKSKPSFKNNIYPEKFELFWDSYPKRNGKREGKKPSLAMFNKIKADELDLVLKGVKIYATKCGEFAKDPIRFLRDEIWRDLTDIQKEAPKRDLAAESREQFNWKLPEGV